MAPDQENSPALAPDVSDTEDRDESQGLRIQVIGLHVAEEHFIVDILRVREIVRLGELVTTRVPHAHPYVLGVTNLRGKVVPVIDMGARLRLAPTVKTPAARMIVVEMGENGVGFTVDSVSEVLSLEAETLATPASAEPYVEGVTTLNGRILTLLNLEMLLAPPERNLGRRPSGE